MHVSAVHIGDEDFFESHGVHGLNGCARIVAGGNHGRFEAIGGEHGKAAAAAHLDDSGKLWQGRVRGQHEAQSAPAVEESLFVIGGDDAAAIDERNLIGDLFDVEGVIRADSQEFHSVHARHLDVENSEIGRTALQTL